MNTSTRDSMNDAANVGGDLGRRALRLGWNAVRFPVLSFLVILEPVVRFLFSGLALLGVLLAFFFEFSGAAPHFPFWNVLAISIGCVLVLAIYYGFIRLLSR